MHKIKMGMVGGGEGAFIGAIHRMAAAMQGQIELVCGAFSRDAERALRAGIALGLSASRSYATWQQMLAAEAALPAEQRMQFVVIATPNHLHFPIACAALNAGFHVLSDKPAARDLVEAKALRECVARSGLLYALTHTYTGYPLIEEARARVMRGDFGRLRRVVVDYTQGWLAEPQLDNPQARWRLDPERAGISCCMADIGTHAFNLLEYVTCLQVDAVCADLRSVVPGRVLDDDGSVLLRLNTGVRGVLTASQICAGEENSLSLRVYGELGGLEWQQQEPNTLWLKWRDRPAEMLRAATPWLGAAARNGSYLPAGHPEGYLEAFANIYRRFADAVRVFPSAVAPSVQGALKDPLQGTLVGELQGIDAGVRAMAFVEAAVNSSANGAQWREIQS